MATQIDPEFKLIRFNGKETKHVIISDAVRASMSIPGIFEPHVIHYKDKQNKRYTRNDAPQCVDGGLISNFPLNIFDNLEFQKDHVKGRGWENREIPNPRTLGAALRIIEDKKECEKGVEIKTPLDIIKALVSVYFNSEAILAISKEFNRDRVIEIPIEGVGLFDFNLSQEQKKDMIQLGKQSVNKAPSLQGKIGNIANPAKREQTNFFSNRIHDHFIERNQYSKILKSKISFASTPSPGIQVYVLYGLPGMGKTQIAVNFAARHRDDFSHIWIIDCRSEGQKNRCYEEIAEKLKIKWNGMKEAKLREEVHKSLANPPKGEKPWLLILDNVDQPLSREVDLPKNGGYILVTTNKKDNCPWGESLEEVGPLSNKESLDLLQKITLEKSSDEMSQLVTSLGNFPLALNLSAQCIKINRLTIKQFIATYDFKRTAPPIEKDEFYEYTLKNVWDITLRGIEKDCPEALEWLTMCAFLNPDQIPQSLVMKWAKSKFSSEAVAEKNSLRILKTLQRYHVFHQTNKKDTYSIHGFLQQVLRNKQGEMQSKNFQTIFSFFKEMGKELETPIILPPEKLKTLEDWWPIQFSRLFENSEFIDKISDQDKVQALMALTNYTIYNVEDFRLGIYFANLGLQLSHDDPSKQALFLESLGYAYGALGNYSEAEKYASRNFDITTELFDKNSLEVAKQKLNLIQNQLPLYSFRKNQGQMQQAINDLQKLLEIFKKDDNGINRTVFLCLSNISDALNSLSSLEKDQVRKKNLKEQSLRTWQEALTILKQIPYDHVDIVLTNIPISNLLIDLTQYLEAEEILEESRHLQKKINKKSIPMWIIEKNLGRVYYGLAITVKTEEEKRNLLKKAQDKQLKALKMIEELVDESHYYISLSLFELAKIYENQNELGQSLNYLEKSYVIRKEYFKTDQHWEVQEVLNAITRVQKKQNPNHSWYSRFSDYVKSWSS